MRSLAFRLLQLLLLLLVTTLSQVALAATWAGRGKPGAEPSATLVELQPDKALVQIEVPGVWLSEIQGSGTAFQQITLPRGQERGVLGGPGLPEAGLAVTLPRGRAVRTRVLSLESDSLGSFLPAPVQERSCRCGKGSPKSFQFRPESYRGVVPLPTSATAEIVDRGFLREVSLGVLRVRPIVFEPATQTVLLRTHILVEIDFAQQDPAAFPPRVFETLPRSFGALLEQVPVHLDSWRSNQTPEHLLVLGPASYLSSAKPLIDWRVESGSKVTAVNMESLGTSASAVKSYLLSAYSSWSDPPSAVLLVGDENAVPPMYGKASGGASDYLFTTLAGSDLYPDILLGRLSARTTTEVATQVAKIVAYEKSPSSGSSADWYKSAVLISSSEGLGSSNDDVWSGLIYDSLEAWGYDPMTKLYASLNTNTNANINSAIQSGVSWISYLGHGTETAWASTNPTYEAPSQVPNLSNGDKLPVLWDVACLNGAFDLDAPCFAEIWMNAQGRGAVGVWASTVLASWDEPARWSVEAARAFAQTGTYRFGEAVLGGMLGLLSAMGTGPYVTAELEKFVLFGDPLLEIRSRQPAVLSLSHPSTASQAGGLFDVAVLAGGVPVERARVAATAQGQVLAVGLTNATGQVNLDLPPLFSPSFLLTVTARDGIPIQETVLSQPPGCGLLMLSEQGLVSCSQALVLTVVDEHLDLSPTTLDTAQVSVGVGSNTTPIALQETGPSTHTFQGQVLFAVNPTGTEIALQNGNTVTVSYQDADCQGTPLTIAKSLTAQCDPPQISGVAVDQITAASARIRWTTNVPATSSLDYGETSNLDHSKMLDSLVSVHELTLTALKKGTPYFFRVRSEDQVHNSATDDNGGAFYSFVTELCDPNCAGKQCGADGCGGSCGTCGLGANCNTSNGHCECPTSSNPGCGGCPCEAAVCAEDAFCCNVAWDGQCAAKCLQHGGCAVPGTDGGVQDSGPASDAADASAEALDAQADSLLEAETQPEAERDAQPAEAEADSEGSAGSTGAAGEGGERADTATADSAGVQEAGVAPAGEDADKGCDCRSAGARKSSWGPLAGIIALLGIRLRRRGARPRL